ncbi:unnamed protein product [Microthlaspi erraticum]|uniref:CCHC-type domain-containing protein n=1 Tax=Microthlaspi erraticum TaxID=1685480 RepID=A0A6D2J0G8_9BRAS|nr:unnamed protein product [Microthlaspi erraticum]
MSIVAHDPKYKKISPYDLTSGDNPGAVISQPLLNGLNYDEWALNFRMALISRKKFEFLDGSIPKPAAGDPHLEDWIANNHLMLRNALATCKQNGSTVDDYFGRLTKIWDGIAECMNTKRCSCGKCECDLNTAYDNEKEILRVHDFLSGLDDSTHGVFRSQLCAITPLPDLDSIYKTIVQNETLRLNSIPDLAVMGFAAQASGPMNQVWTHDVPRQSSDQPNNVGFGSTNRDPTRKCTSCGKSGHEASACFKVIGYPDWWPNKPHNKIGAQGSQGSVMGRGRGFTPRVNSTQIASANTAAVESSLLLTDADRQGLSGLSDEQCRLVQQFLNAGKSSSPTGVTDKLMILQDRITRMLIGAGEREGEGLYRFRGIEMVTALQTSVRPDMSLWHKCLGHPSFSVTGIVSGVTCSSSDSDMSFMLRVVMYIFVQNKLNSVFPIV